VTVIIIDHDISLRCLEERERERERVKRQKNIKTRLFSCAKNSLDVVFYGFVALVGILSMFMTMTMTMLEGKRASIQYKRERNRDKKKHN
jgi:hypothetical protein